MVIKLLKEIMQHIAEAQACLDDLQTFQSGFKSLARALRAEMTAVKIENNVLRADMTALQTIVTDLTTRLATK